MLGVSQDWRNDSFAGENVGSAPKDTIMKKAVLVLLLGGALSSPVFAAGYNFLKGSPISRFSKNEMNLFTTTLYKMLDESPDGTVSSWGDTAKGGGGRIEI